MQNALVLVLLTAGLSASLTCPDGKLCPTKDGGQQCCPKQHDVQEGTRLVYCDSQFACRDGSTCCRHPSGGWTCCPFSPGQCCLDGFHCCPFGYQCDWTYTRCLRNGLPYPFALQKSAISDKNSVIAVAKPTTEPQDKFCPEGTLCDERGVNVVIPNRVQTLVTHCDNRFYCPNGNTCCQKPSGQWGCCPYSLGECCTDGEHCCEYGFRCDKHSTGCKSGYIQVPSAFNDALEG